MTTFNAETHCVMENGVDVSPEQDIDDEDGHIEPIVKSVEDRNQTQSSMTDNNTPYGKVNHREIIENGVNVSPEQGIDDKNGHIVAERLDDRNLTQFSMTDKNTPDGKVNHQEVIENGVSVSPGQDLDELDGEPIIVKTKVPLYETQVSMTDKIAPNGTVKHRKPSQNHHQPEMASPMDAIDTGQGEETPSETESVTNLKVHNRKKGKLKINGNVTFCEIVTVCYIEGDRRTKQHYIQEVKGQVDGDIGLQPLDELIKVNEHELTNKSQKEVQKIFRNIKLDKETHTLKLSLTVRRWKKSEDSPVDDPVWTAVWKIEYDLVLGVEEPITKIKAKKFRSIVQNVLPNRRRIDPRMSVRNIRKNIRSTESLHDGNIEVGTIYTPHPCHVAYMTNDTFAGPYFHVSSDGLLSLEPLESENSDIFTAEPFLGTDTGPKPFSLEVFCVRLYTQRNDSKWFLCYDEDYDVMCKLHNDDAIETENIDARCFIKRKFGDKQLFQSATDRDLFIRYDSDTKTFKMQDIDSKYLLGLAKKEEDSFAKFHGCWFQIIDTEECTENQTFGVLKLLSCGMFRSSSLKRADRGHRPTVRR